jgi:hypothetical protein
MHEKFDVKALSPLDLERLAAKAAKTKIGTATVAQVFDAVLKIVEDAVMPLRARIDFLEKEHRRSIIAECGAPSRFTSAGIGAPTAAIFGVPRRSRRDSARERPLICGSWRFGRAETQNDDHCRNGRETRQTNFNVAPSRTGARGRKIPRLSPSGSCGMVTAGDPAAPRVMLRIRDAILNESNDDRAAEELQSALSDLLS